MQIYDYKFDLWYRKFAEYEFFMYARFIYIKMEWKEKAKNKNINPKQLLVLLLLLAYFESVSSAYSHIFGNGKAT